MTTQQPKIGFITLGHTYFDPLADKTGLVAAVEAAWADLPFTLVPAPEIPKDVATTANMCDFFEKQGVDGLIINAGAYGFENLVSVVGMNTARPILVWCPESAPQALIPASAFVSSTVNLKNLKRHFFSFIGNMDSPETCTELTAFAKAARASRMMRRATLGMVGGACPGMSDTTFSEYHLRRFVPGLLSLDIQNILEAMAAVSEAEIKEGVEKTHASFGGVAADETHLATAVRSYVAMKNLAKDFNLDAMTVRCWPEISQKGFSGALGASLMCEDGIVCMMERDVPATATALALQYLTDRPSFIGEMDHLDVSAGRAYFVNDNSMLPSLVESREAHQVVGGDIFISVTSGQSDGAMVMGTLKTGPVTLAKLRGTPGEADRLSMAITAGESLSFTPPEGTLCNACLTFDQPVNDFVYTWTDNGFEHHMVINHEDASRALTMLCEIMEVTPVVI